MDERNEISANLQMLEDKLVAVGDDAALSEAEASEMMARYIPSAGAASMAPAAQSRSNAAAGASAELPFVAPAVGQKSHRRVSVAEEARVPMAA
jgi:hypothetical protein